MIGKQFVDVSPSVSHTLAISCTDFIKSKETTFCMGQP